MSLKRKIRCWIENFREDETRRFEKKWKNWSFETTWINFAYCTFKLRTTEKDWHRLTWDWLLIKIEAGWIWLSFKTLGRGDKQYGIKGNLMNNGAYEHMRMRGLNKINLKSDGLKKEGRRRERLIDIWKMEVGRWRVKNIARAYVTRMIKIKRRGNLSQRLMRSWNETQTFWALEINANPAVGKGKNIKTSWRRLYSKIEWALKRNRIKEWND